MVFQQNIRKQRTGAQRLQYFGTTFLMPLSRYRIYQLWVAIDLCVFVVIDLGWSFKNKVGPN